VSNIIDVTIYSAQMDGPSEFQNIMDIDCVLDAIDELPQGFMYDLYIDVYKEDDPYSQMSFNALGQFNLEHMKMFCDEIWTMIIFNDWNI
jgi:hypothetical protein